MVLVHKAIARLALIIMTLCSGANRSRHRSLTPFPRLLTFCSDPAQSLSVTSFHSLLRANHALPDPAASSLDDDSQGAQSLAPRIPDRALPKRGPCYTFPDVHVACGSTGRGAVPLPPGQSTKHSSLLSCRYFSSRTS